MAVSFDDQNANYTIDSEFLSKFLQFQNGGPFKKSAAFLVLKNS